MSKGEKEEPCNGLGAQASQNGAAIRLGAGQKPKGNGPTPGKAT